MGTWTYMHICDSNIIFEQVVAGHSCTASADAAHLMCTVVLGCSLQGLAVPCLQQRQMRVS